MNALAVAGFAQGAYEVQAFMSRKEQMVSTPGFNVLFWICAIGLVGMYIYIEKKRM
ncbi:MAG: hypothetical protein ACRCW2_09145 [Cellulosilyticaceae bacterium]